MENHGYIGKSSKFRLKKSNSDLQFEKFTPLISTQQIKNTLMTSIPNDTLRAFLEFDNNGKSKFINDTQETVSGLEKIPQLAQTVIDGFLDESEEVFYPFDIPVFKGNQIATFKKRFETLMYTLDLINDNSETLILSTNFDDSIENLLAEQENFIIFIKLNSEYTPGSINKNVKIWKTATDDIFISLNIHEYRGNRWKVDIDSQKIPEVLLPQREKSIEIPVVFTKSLHDNDIVLFKINLNNNKPLLPIEKLSRHINDYTDIVNILESIKIPIKRQELIS
jgi:hypothetical protein